MISSLLIANRGEIACRIIRTARRMGIRTVAVYSDADARALHVRQADQAIHIGPSPARESYLVGEKIIAAARESGAEAIHPGYGFLSENADFAQAVIDAGLIWVGPKPDSIRAMGLKDAAKKLMADAGVPVTPGYLGEDQSPGRLKSEADAIGYPVLIKAIAGGGGKGMRRVNDSGEFDGMLASCKREAAAAFGDDRVLIEKYVERPRHIEVQVFGDSHGNIVHLFERDCSLQRRHQKVIEEAPAPGMDEATRAAICEAAVKAARAVDYVGAGTIEFIADASEGLRADRIWFMEMNTRLQVEHPVTEEITGQDLVEWQLRVASGEALPKKQEELAINGWAMEARLYAEDPAAGFLPSIGKLERFDLPSSSKHDTGRIETGFEVADEVSTFYDPMLAKLVVHRESREAALRSLALDCSYVCCWPVKSNAGLLWRALEHPRFRQGDIDTNLLVTEFDGIVPPDEPSENALQSLASHIFDSNQATCSSPWELRFGWRLNGAVEQLLKVEAEGRAYEICYDPSFEGSSRWVEQTPDGYLVNDLGVTYVFSPWKGGKGAEGDTVSGAIISPMPGRLIAVAVEPGEAVTKGQKLLTIEAMKMEHSLVAPFDGIVTEVQAVEGAQVTEGALLARIEKASG